MVNERSNQELCVGSMAYFDLYEGLIVQGGGFEPPNH
jgi:hypothetical protein